MKTYKVKNYKGNLVESLSKFQKSHKGMKIVEAVEDGDDLKIKAEGQYDDAPPNPDLMEIVEPLKECLEAYDSWFSDVVTDENHRDDFESFLEALKQFANEMDCPSTSGGKDEYAKLIKAITKFEDDCDKYFEYWDEK